MKVQLAMDHWFISMAARVSTFFGYSDQGRRAPWLASPDSVLRTPGLPFRDLLLLLYRDCRNLDSGIVDQGCSLDGGARRLGIGHNIFVGLVHVRELVNIGEIDCDADNVLEFEAGGF